MIDTVEGYRAFEARYRAVVAARIERARSLCHAAGVSCFLQLHNALVGLHYGKPWHGVDYRLARKAARVLQHAHDDRELLDRVWLRVCRKQFGFKG